MTDLQGDEDVGQYYFRTVNTVSVAIEVSSTALFFYDFFLTLPQEVNKIWRRKVTIATVLFLLNRYVFMMSRGMRTVQAVSWHHFFEQDTNRICTITWSFIEICEGITNTVIVVIAAIRIFAIWGRNHIIFMFVLVVGLISPIVTSYYATTRVFSAFKPPLTGCGQHSSLPTDARLIRNGDEFFFLLEAMTAALFECAVIILTWIKTAHIQRALRSINSAEGSKGISYLLLRHGVIHFGTVMVLGILGFMGVVIERLYNISAITATLTSILVSRLVLDLRDNYVSSEAVTDVSLRLPHTATLQFSSPQSSRFIGNLGGTLRLDDDDDDEMGVEEAELELECGGGDSHEYGPADDCETPPIQASSLVITESRMDAVE